MDQGRRGRFGVPPAAWTRAEAADIEKAHEESSGSLPVGRMPAAVAEGQPDGIDAARLRGGAT